MKKIFSLVFAVLFVSGMAVAQDDPGKLMKKATRALGAYNLDPANNSAKLAEAKDLIDQAFAGDALANDPQALLAKGEIYNTLSTNDAMKASLDPEYVVKYPEAPLKAYAAYSTALEKADKKYMVRDAVSGLETVQRNLQGLGISAFDKGDFATAYEALLGTAELHSVLTENKGKSAFENETGANDLRFYAGLAAINGGMQDKATPIFENLVEQGYDKAEVYDGLFKVYETSDPAKAEKILMDARKRFPDNVTLLFTEINYYLKNDRLDELTGRLETAIEKEPDNISLRNTLGNVYDNLYQQEVKKEDADPAKLDMYLAKAQESYNQALEIEPNNSDALYSMGALYFNQGALASQQMMKLSEDFSAAGVKKYDAKKAEMLKHFDEALPFFIKAEKANPNNTNTLIALKEIYARKDKLDMVKELGDRIEAVNNGEKVDGSYFESKGM